MPKVAVGRHVGSDAAVHHDLRPLAAADVLQRGEPQVAHRGFVGLALDRDGGGIVGRIMLGDMISKSA